MRQIPDLFYDYLPTLSLPENFWTAGNEKEKCIYLGTCTEDEFLYVTDAFETILGYSSELLYKGGLTWWFSLIHPEDIKQMLNTIFQHCFLAPVANRLNKPFTLTYRIKHADQRWIRIQETKCIVAVTEEEQNHFIVGHFEEISVNLAPDESEILRLIRENDGKNCMMKAALPILTGKTGTDTSAPTKREKEILDLIGEGFSTKQIADKLQISVNTVETHRRHLLEKLNVKNSMELIKKTSRAFWPEAVS